MSFGVFSFGHIGCEPEHLNTMLSFSADQVSVLSPLPLHHHPTSLPFASLTCHHKTIPALSVRAHPPLDIFSSHFVDRVGYVSFRTFSKWHWKNSRAPSDAGRGMPRNRARNGVSRRSLRPRSTATASAARGSPVPCRASSFTSSVSSRAGKMSLQFLQERARAKNDRRARVTVPHSFSYSVHSVRASEGQKSGDSDRH